MDGCPCCLVSGSGGGPPTALSTVGFDQSRWIWLEPFVTLNLANKRDNRLNVTLG